MFLKFIFVNIAENNLSDGLPPVRISPHKDFSFGVKRFCPGHNKIDLSVIQCEISSLWITFGMLIAGKW